MSPRCQLRRLSSVIVTASVLTLVTAGAARPPRLLLAEGRALDTTLRRAPGLRTDRLSARRRSAGGRSSAGLADDDQLFTFTEDVGRGHEWPQGHVELPEAGGSACAWPTSSASRCPSGRTDRTVQLNLEAIDSGTVGTRRTADSPPGLGRGQYAEVRPPPAVWTGRSGAGRRSLARSQSLTLLRAPSEARRAYEIRRQMSQLGRRPGMRHRRRPPGSVQEAVTRASANPVD
jgi:hypothetical protein